ncbi:MAG TPA: hypothetical protein VGN12_28890 [Pirellulales bacterium]|jgi:hypothetical protein
MVNLLSKRADVVIRLGPEIARLGIWLVLVEVRPEFIPPTIVAGVRFYVRFVIPLRTTVIASRTTGIVTRAAPAGDQREDDGPTISKARNTT